MYTYIAVHVFATAVDGASKAHYDVRAWYSYARRVNFKLVALPILLLYVARNLQIAFFAYPSADQGDNCFTAKPTPLRLQHQELARICAG